VAAYRTLATTDLIRKSVMAASKLTAKTLEAAKPSEHAYRIRNGTPLSPDSTTQSPPPQVQSHLPFGIPVLNARGVVSIRQASTRPPGRAGKTYPSPITGKTRSATLRLRKTVTGGIDPLEEDKRKEATEKRRQEQA
jgi:hypothetical protein